MSKPQLTSLRTCKRKHTYRNLKAANAARKRRNNNSLQSLYFAAAYQCNVCNFYHLTTQEQGKLDEPRNTQSKERDDG